MATQKMIEYLKSSLIPIAIALITGISGYFQGVGAAKTQASTALDNRLAFLETKNEVQDTLITEHEKADEKAQAMIEKKFDRFETKIDALLLERGLSPKEVVGAIPAREEGHDEGLVGLPELATSTHERN